MARHTFEVFKSFSFTLLLLCSVLGSAQAQVESVTITQISPHIIAARPATPTFVSSMKGYEYRITLELYSTDLELQTTPVLFIVCFLPDQTIQTIPVARENIRTQSNDRYECVFSLLIPKKGSTGFTVATESELSKKSSAEYFSRLTTSQKIVLPLASDVE